jgi:hypothetical protein
VVLLASGCSGGGQEVVYDPADYRPEVDTGAPLEVQEKQDAIIRAFSAIQEGLGWEELAERHQDVRLEEPAESFYAEGAMLHLFKWNGPPEGDDFPVRIVLNKNEPGLPTVELQRVYTVTKEESIFVIQRKN